MNGSRKPGRLGHALLQPDAPGCYRILAKRRTPSIAVVCVSFTWWISWQRRLAWREATAAAVFHSPLGMAAMKNLTGS